MGSGMQLNPLKVPLVSFAGLAAVVIFCAFAALAIARFPPGFSPSVNWISDLGNTNLNPWGAGVFNAGCEIAGVLVAIFFVGLYPWYTVERWRNLMVAGAQVTGVAAGLSLIMVGLYPEVFASEHYLWSGAFFVSLCLALVLANAALYSHRKFNPVVAVVGLAAAVVVVVFIASKLTAVEVPILEWASVATALIWALAVAVDAYLTFT
ncbi:MAG TPA: DUF998 domain-containing protein [Methanocella sp.]|nr:DUF998 domain-containing protein [Methanocella sp.]